MAYIDKEKFLKKIAKCFGHFGVMVKAIEEIAEECTEKDVVDVVRCKDCAYNSEDEGCIPHLEDEGGIKFFPCDDHFCSYGKKKAGDQT